MTESNASIRWYAASAAPFYKSEFKAEKNLTRQGFVTYLPYEWVQKKRGRPNKPGFKLEWVKEAFFPGYLFVAINRDGQSFYQINETEGISGVVQQGPDPIEIPPILMQDLLARADETGLVARRELPKRKPFDQGQRVKFIDDSPLSVIFGRVIKDPVFVDKTERVKVLMKIIGKEQAIDISPHLLKAV